MINFSFSTSIYVKWVLNVCDEPWLRATVYQPQCTRRTDKYADKGPAEQCLCSRNKAPSKLLHCCCGPDAAMLSRVTPPHHRTSRPLTPTKSANPPPSIFYLPNPLSTESPPYLRSAASRPIRKSPSLPPSLPTHKS